MITLFIFLILSVSFKPTKAQDECGPTSCSPSGPIIRFPFRLKGLQPEHCGYPGFDLSCNRNNLTEFEFQFPVRASARNVVVPISAKATVRNIDYSAQVIGIDVVSGSCLPNRVPDVSSPAPPFELHNRFADSGFTLFNCSGKPGSMNQASGPITCLKHGGFEVYAFGSYYSSTELSVSNCVKMYNVSYIAMAILIGPRESSFDGPWLHWSEPSCRNCEGNGMYCRLKNNGTNNETECFDKPKEPEVEHKKKKGVSKGVVIAVVIVGVFVVALAFAALLYVCTAKKRERRIDKFLEDYKALRPTRYSYSDVKRITDGFKHKLGQGGYGTVYKGELSTEIPVAVKVLNIMKGNGEDFINEVATIGKIHHVNVVRLVGYCADGYRRALVYEYLENDSLEKYISSRKQSKPLGWEKLLDVALGIAKGLDYLHQGCNQRILHFDIKPHNILLDHNLSPKVADFGLAKLCSKEQSVVTMTAARGTIGYIAPEVFSRNFGKVSYKSDIYSYGMLLLDMVGGRKNFNMAAAQDNSEVYFPEWMYNQLENGGDLEIEIEKEEENDIVKRLIIVGLWCIQWYPADRPSTKVVIQMLEGENMPVMPPNPFGGSEPVNTSSTSNAISSDSSFFSSPTSIMSTK